MHSIHHPAGTRLGLVRLLAALGCATMLAGCYTNQEVATPAASDYRLRHPIAIKEGPRTLQLFVGPSRGGLNGEQRADVIAFANRWRQEATGGIIIDLPAGTKNEVAAANAVHEVRAILSAAGLPPNAVAVRQYTPNDPGKLGTLKNSASGKRPCSPTTRARFCRTRASTVDCAAARRKVVSARTRSLERA
jgi:pilus assembly protein CpaD